MRRGAIHRASDDACLIPLTWKTANTWERMRGLLGRQALGPGQALLIDPCPSVHTLGMAYPIDLVFLDANYRVLKLVPQLKPSRWAGCAGARATIELAPGAIAALALSLGDVLQWRGT